VNLVRSEAIKLLATRRTAIVVVLALLAIVGIGTAGTVDSGSDSFTERGVVLRDVITGPAGTAAFFALIAGILVATWEYQHGTITHTLLVTPRRERVFGAKTVLGLACGLILTGVALLVALVIALPWLGAEMSSELWGLVGRVLASGALWGAIGVALGLLVASQVGAIVSTLIWFVVVEPIVGTLLDDTARYLPLRAVQALQGGDVDGLSGLGGAGLTLAYLGAFAVIGLAATLRRDIT
jgi:ABC-2 type transport system permease protein